CVTGVARCGEGEDSTMRGGRMSLVGLLLLLATAIGAPGGASGTAVAADAVTYSQVSAGYDHTCGLTTTGSIVCWGDDQYGQTNVTAGTYSQVSAGYDHTCGLTTAGSIVCWGDSTPPVITPTVSGTLGDNDWYTDDVIVTWKVTDDESDITNPDGCDETSITADTAETTLTCTATSTGGTTAESVTIKRDATVPTLSPSVTPDPVLLNGTATASAKATDDRSGIASQQCDTPDTSAAGAHSVDCTATDNAGNVATARAAYTVVAPDSTAPEITPTVSGTLGVNDWYTSDVTVSWSVADAESDIASTDGCDDTSITADTNGTTLTCTATSTGGTTTDTVTIKRDATSPSLDPSVTPDSVLVNGSASASPNATDATSGVVSASCESLDTTSVGVKSVTCTATDAAGNVATASASYTVVDATPPVITPTVSGTLGDNDWYTSDVTVSWSVTDDESSISESTGCKAITIDTDTAGTTLTCTATSAGGEASASVTIKRDATAPVVTFTGNQGSYGLLDTIAITCTASDATSGLASDTCEDISGSASSFGPGQHDFSAEATDLAGNVGSATTSFSVAASYADLCTLTRQYVNRSTTARSACIILEVARQAEARGQSFIEQVALIGYRVQIQSAISRRYISAAHGAELIAWSRTL
ncbi:MAG: RCC1 domain-containing protein, partial [Chloroflexota bacterium]|nr:RCC1 domain-containing protein [Chloroflexota bacterium]